MDPSKNFSFDPSKLSKATADEYMSTSDEDDEDDNVYRMPGTDPTATEFGNFNPRKRRRTGRNAKESAALGIFGSESEDEDQGANGRRWKRKPLRRQGMAFVSAGAKADTDEENEEEKESFDKIKARLENDSNEDTGESDKSGKNNETGQSDRVDNKDEDEDEDEDNYDDEAGGVGLGFGSSGGHGLGFMVDTQPSAPSASTPFFKPRARGVDAANPLGRGFVPSSARDPVLKVQDDDNDAGQPKLVPRPSAFSSNLNGGKGKNKGTAANGQTTYNPKSFGARMMAKMGYVAGQGLGKEGQGRNIIIEANLRPQGAGLGAVKEKSEKEKQEEKRQARMRGETVVDSDEEEPKAKATARRNRALGNSNTHSGASTPRRPKTKFLTVEEAKKAAPGLNIPDAFTPILDMTGPGRKLLTTSSGLMTPTSGSPSGTTPMEETAEQMESRKLARRAQTDFMAILEEWQSLQNRKAYTNLQTKQEQQELTELEANLDAHQTITTAFSKLSTQDDVDPSGWEPRWDNTIAQLKTAADTIPESLLHEMTDDLVAISVAAIHPVFKDALVDWHPLKDPNTKLVQGLTSIQSLLRDGKSKDLRRHRKSAATPYETMMYKIWLPHISRAVRDWDVHDPDGLLATFEAWDDLVPDFVKAQLLDQDIVRKLDAGVAAWEPKRKRRHQGTHTLPHLWLFPWLPHLPARQLDPRSADGLVAEVKRKFRQLVSVWEFYRGVVPGLQQWRAVLQPSLDNDQWRPLVISHVLPSMARYARAQFAVDATGHAGRQMPYLEVLTGEFAWLEGGLVGGNALAEVLVKEVFPMWHAALYRLLTTPGLATLDEIGQWVAWWVQEVFPLEVRQQPSVVAEFARGLSMLNEALDLGGDPERVRQSLPPPEKATSSRSGRSHSHGHSNNHTSSHHRHHSHSHSHGKPKSVTPMDLSGDKEEMTIRHYVEEWCENNDLQFIPERKKVHAEGPLYRITARGDGKGGVLAYFKGVRLYVDSKKGPVEIRVDREEDWAKLLAMAG